MLAKYFSINSAIQQRPTNANVTHGWLLVLAAGDVPLLVVGAAEGAAAVQLDVELVLAVARPVDVDAVRVVGVACEGKG